MNWLPSIIGIMAAIVLAFLTTWEIAVAIFVMLWMNNLANA